MRQKLYELIRDCDCGCSGCDGCKYEDDEAECISHMAYQMTDHLIANGVNLRPKGEWVQVICHVCFEDGFVDRLYEHCSRCHEPNGRRASDFCPNCGADMRGEGDAR